MKTLIKINIYNLTIIVLIFISKSFFGNPIEINTDPIINYSGLIINNKSIERFHVFNNIGVKFTRNTDLSNAIRNFEKSLALEPDNIYIKYNLANALMIDNQNSKAIDIYNSLIGSEIDQSYIRLNLATSYQQNNQLSEAIELFTSLHHFEAAFNASILLRKNNEINKALIEAKRALVFNVDDQYKVMALSNYSKLLYLNGDVKSAIIYLKRAISIDENSMDKKNELANYYLTLGDHKNAKKVFETIAKKKSLNPFYYQAVIGICKVDLKNQNYLECIDKINRVIKKQINNPRAYLIKAQALLNLKDYENAEFYFNKSLDLGLLAEAKIGLAILRHKQNEFHKSKLIYDSLNSKEKAYFSYDDLVVFSLNEYNLGNISEAKNFVQLAVINNPNRAEAYGYLGKFSYDEFDFHTSQDYYKKAIKLAPDKSVYRICLANCYAQTGKYRTALSVFNKLIDDNPDYAKAYSAKAMCLLMIDKTKEGLIEINKAISLDPDEPFNYMNKAYALTTLAMEEENEEAKQIILNEALKDIYFAKKIDTSTVSIFYENNLAMIYLEKGELEKCHELLIKDTNSVTVNNIGIYLEEIGRQSEAISKYNEVLSVDPFHQSSKLNIERLESNKSKKNIMWKDYWVFLTNDLAEMETHTFSNTIFIPKQSEISLKNVQYYSYEQYRKKTDEVNQVKFKKENPKEVNNCLGCCPTF